MRRLLLGTTLLVLVVAPAHAQNSTSPVPDFSGTVFAPGPLDYAKPPFGYKGSRFYTVEFRTTAAAARALVPAPLEAGPDSILQFVFAHHRIVEPADLEYLEAYLAVPVSYRGKPGTYLPVLYLDDAAAVTGGREIWGFNKYPAEFQVREEDDALRVSISRAGTTLIQAEFRLSGDVTPPGPVESYSYNIKHIQSVERGAPPAVRQLTGLPMNFHTTRLRPAAASLTFSGLPPYEPWDRIPILNVVRAWFSEQDFTLGYGEVLESLQPREPGVSADRPAADTVTKILQAYGTAWDNRDAAHFKGVVAPDARYVEAATGNVFVGPEGFARYMAATFAGSKDSQTKNTSTIFDGNTLVTEWVWSGVHTGSWLGETPTGREFSIPGITVVEVKDGMIQRVADYWDLYTWLHQLGYLPTLEEFGQSILADSASSR
ncbi:MAG: acetoacetate decarboxylase family protein [Gemmatimonadota bacterium]